MLAHAGQWYVADFSAALKPGKTLVKTIADQEIVLWRQTTKLNAEGQSVQAASAVCPHWGGPLAEGKVGAAGELTCPWHGWQFQDGACRNRPRLKLPHYLAHDDGILLWVRLPWDLQEITQPPLQQRPANSRHFWFNMGIDPAWWQAGPQELYDADNVDGATASQRFRNVTMPLISPTTFFLFVLQMIGAFQLFTEAYVMTRGSSGTPAQATMTVVYYIYQNAFSYNRMGKAAAVAWFLFLFIFLFTLIQTRMQRRWVYYEVN